MIEPTVDLGEKADNGQVVARIHPTGRTGAATQEIRAKLSGMLAARHFPGLVKSGDCVAVVATVDG